MGAMMMNNRSDLRVVLPCLEIALLCLEVALLGSKIISVIWPQSWVFMPQSLSFS